MITTIKLKKSVHDIVKEIQAKNKDVVISYDNNEIKIIDDKNILTEQEILEFKNCAKNDF
jgi:hypothetical protein